MYILILLYICLRGLTKIKNFKAKIQSRKAHITNSKLKGSVKR